MLRSIKILHVLHTFSHGGLENGIVNIINRSPDHLIHELCVLTKGKEFLLRLTRPVVFHELNKGQGNDVRFIFRLRELFRRRDVDVIHTRNWAAFDAVLAACLTPKTTLVHGEHGRDSWDPKGLVYHRNLARRLLAFRVKKYVAVSNDLYTWLRQTVHIPERKLELILNGVDTERFYPGRDLQIRAELGIAEDEFVVGSVGRLDPIKNHEGLIRALRILKNPPNKVRLVIVGDGPHRAKVESALRMSSLVPTPILLGYRTDVERLYRAFDLFALNSLGEGMSNTLLEAMASGLPIVCTAIGGNVDLIVDKENGALVTPGNDPAMAAKVHEYMISPHERSVHGERVRKLVVERFSIKRMIEQYVALYESVA